MASQHTVRRNWRIAAWTLGAVYWIALIAGLWHVRANGPLIVFGVLWATVAHAVLFALYRCWSPAVTFIEAQPKYIDITVHVPPVGKHKHKQYVLLWCAKSPHAKNASEDGVYLVTAISVAGQYRAHVRQETPFIFCERSEMRDGTLTCIDWRLLNPPVAV